MNRTRILTAMFAALVVFGATIVNAQEFSNPGELLDKGGKRLDATELKALVTGATVSGMVLRPGSRIGFDVTYENDGKANGRLYGLPTDAGRGTTGRWTVNEQGELCAEMLSVAFGATKTCSYYYRLNDNYYSAASNERSAFVRTRTIKR
jgi:hypothetical protein